MNNQDTVTLLQSCHRGTCTAISSIEQVMEHVENPELQQRLEATLKRHKDLGEEIDRRLNAHGEEGARPGPMARRGVWMTTEMRMMMDSADGRDHQIAKLIINGCNTGIQGLSEDINHLKDASGECMDLATSLVTEEQRLMDDLRLYL